MNLRRTLRRLVEQKNGLVVPGAYDGVSARLVERAGFPAVYMTGFGTSASRLGLPDLGYAGLAEMSDHARNLAATVAPSSLAETKRQLYTDLHRDAASAVADSEGLLNRMTREPDYREGVRAWLEKRPPQWPPR